MFTEEDTTEQMILTTLQRNGWKYIPAEQLQRDYSDVYVESMVKDALIRLNPVISEDESKADEVIFKLRALFLSTNPQNLVTQNEAFKQFVRLSSLEQKSMASWIRMNTSLRTSGYIRKKKAESDLISSF